MLVELAVRDLGVIADLRLVFGPGMTVVTGETGAGKTMVVDAIELLVGGRADPVLVRTGGDEAWVEGRFVDQAGEEVVVARAVPRSGRSRAYVNGRLAPAAVLAEIGERFVDLHGQHAHQSLLSLPAQREALDRFGGIDLTDLNDARRQVRSILDERADLGGDERARARELDLVRYQVAEIDGAGLDDAGEEDRLEAEEDALADSTAHREAGAAAVVALTGDGTVSGDGARSAADVVGAALAEVAGRAPFSDLESRLRGVAAEITDVAAELRAVGEAIDEDPERLAIIRQRRQLLRDLRRKYGDDLAEVMAEGERLRARLADLESHDERAAALDTALSEARTVEAHAAARVAEARRSAAPELAALVQANLVDLAMPKARVEIHVGGDGPADDVTILLAANPGTEPQPLTKVASGGELARTMLALRLVLSTAPPTLVFDEVDAGVGGAAAVSVGRALSRLGAGHQVLVVTHLAQVAAYADAQVRVAKHADDDTTVSHVEVLNEADRVIELSRMLSGQPDSIAARFHATELLDTAAGEKGR